MSLPEESVAVNTLPEVTTIPTGKKLIFTDPDTNEGGIITLENLTKQILQNLTTQTFGLDQGNLTLLQAINQLNSKAGTVYCKGIRNFGQKYETIMIRAESINEACFFTILAGASTKQYSAIIYGVTKNNQVMVKEIMNNGNVSVIGNLTDNSITIDIGNWGRGLILSYTPFKIEIK